MTITRGNCSLPATKRMLYGFFVALPLALAGSATVHAGGASGCSFIGSWFGYDSGAMYWTSTASGQNSSKGTYNLEVPSFDATLGSTFPTATKVTIGRGVWKRLDGYSFAVSLIAMVVDADGKTVWIAKLNTVDTMSVNCDTMWVENTLEIYLPWQNPFAETSYFDPIPLDGHSGYRMSVGP